MKEDLLKGLKLAADVVASTFGPKGNLVFSGKAMRFTKDGMTVAKMVAENSEGLNHIAAKLLLDACQRTAQVVGDSTTLTALLVRELLSHPHDPDLSDKRDEAIALLNDIKQNPDKDTLVNAVTTSVNGDQELGEMIAGLVWTIGHKASVRGIPSLGAQTSVEIIPGYLLGGVAHAEMLRAKHVQSSKNRTTYGIFNPVVVLYDKLFSEVGDMQKVLQMYKASSHVGKPLIVVAPKFEDIIIKMALKNSEGDPVKGLYGFPITLVTLTEDRPESYYDLEAGTGARIITPSKPNITQLSFGQAEMLEIRPDGSRLTFLPEFRDELENRSHREGRIGELNQGIGIIYIGGQTEAEHGRLNDMIEDGVMSAQSCLRFGVLPGGGIALLHVSKQIDGPLSKALAVPASLLPQGAEVYDPAEGLIKAIDHAVSLVLEIEKTQYVI